MWFHPGFCFSHLLLLKIVNCSALPFLFHPWQNLKNAGQTTTSSGAQFPAPGLGHVRWHGDFPLAFRTPVCSPNLGRVLWWYFPQPGSTCWFLPLIWRLRPSTDQLRSSHPFLTVRTALLALHVALTCFAHFNQCGFSFLWFSKWGRDLTDCSGRVCKARNIHPSGLRLTVLSRRFCHYALNRYIAGYFSEELIAFSVTELFSAFQWQVELSWLALAHLPLPYLTIPFESRDSGLLPFTNT